jgi:4'-phosphopantetheinyl transferase
MTVTASPVQNHAAGQCRSDQIAYASVKTTASHLVAAEELRTKQARPVWDLIPTKELYNFNCPLFTKDVEIIVGELDCTPEALPRFAALLSVAERTRAARFRFEDGRRRYIVARGRLRLLLAERLDTAPESVEIACRSRGKPMLGGRFFDCGLHFNVSHSENVAVYAFADRREIGIDIEAVREFRDMDSIAARVFSAREHETYLNLEASQRALGFFNCWTRKEAFVKALGDGLRYPLDSFEVSLAPGQQAKLVRVGDLPGDSCAWTLDDFTFGNDYVGAVVAQKRPVLRSDRSLPVAGDP